jgi:hypothetical protein
MAKKYNWKEIRVRNITEQMKSQVKNYCANTGLSESDVGKIAIREFMDKQPENKKKPNQFD